MVIRAENISNEISIDDIRDFIPDTQPYFLVENIVEHVNFSKWEELQEKILKSKIKTVKTLI